MDEVIREAVKGFIKTGEAFDRTLIGKASQHYAAMAPYKNMQIMCEEMLASQNSETKKKK